MIVPCYGLVISSVRIECMWFVYLYYLSCFTDPVRLTYWDQEKMATILQMRFWNQFTFTKMLYFHYNFTNIYFQRSNQQYTRIGSHNILGIEHATSIYLKQRWTSLRRHICVTRPRWVKVIMDENTNRGYHSWEMMLYWDVIKCMIMRFHDYGTLNTLRPRQNVRHFTDDIFR